VEDLYIENGKHGYANSSSMLLKSVGETISPEKIVVLTIYKDLHRTD
jgi:hypothetical protein